jgi:hypothetical protein
MNRKGDMAVKAWLSTLFENPIRGDYESDELPQQNWQWPKDTWFQGRLDYVREHEPRRRFRPPKKFQQQLEQRTA